MWSVPLFPRDGSVPSGRAQVSCVLFLQLVILTGLLPREA